MKLKNIALTIGLCIIGATAYTLNYLAKNDELSSNTKDDINSIVFNSKNIGNDVKRAYTSIGNKDNFDKSTKSLQKNIGKLYDNSISFAKNATGDVYKYLKGTISNTNIKQNKKNNTTKMTKKITKKKK